MVLRTSILRFVRLVSGQHNAGREYLSGRLDIEGDAVVKGQLKVKGDRAKALQLTSIVDSPQPR